MTSVTTVLTKDSDIIIMFCPNKIQNNALRGMRVEVLEKQKHIQHYKKLYGAECQKVKNLKTQIVGMHQKNLHLLEEIENLKRKLKDLAILGKKKNPRTTKEWQQINSDCTKCRRLASFKIILLEMLKSLQACHRAEVSLWLEERKNTFQFLPFRFHPT